jgi:hypothetical protein
MIVNPMFNAYPYIMLLVICLIIVIVAFWKYPPLRVYRRKHNLLVYAVLILIISLIAHQAYDVFLGPNYVSFGLEKTQTPIYAGQENQFGVTCYSNGGKEVHFYMVIQSANATLQVGGLQDYIQLNDTAIMIPFSFHGSGEQTKLVHFTADTNVSGLAFYPSFKRQNDSQVLVTSYLTEIQCNWDSATNSFAMADSPPLVVP